MDQIGEAAPASSEIEPSQHQAMFLAICRQQAHADTRALQQEVARLTRAMLGGWCPSLAVSADDSDVLEGAAACRAGYWLTLTATLSSDPARAEVLLGCAGRLRAACTVGDRPKLRFYPSAPGHPTPGHDELARDWGLATGLRPIELMQTIERQQMVERACPEHPSPPEPAPDRPVHGCDGAQDAPPS